MLSRVTRVPIPDSIRKDWDLHRSLPYPNFNRSGGVLQDLVNELGRRLEYKVTNGRYQGVVNAVGFDGLWISPESHALIVEVKTTDAYRVSLDTIARYREALRSAGTISDDSSVLVVVGRQDTGELEAQVRGSRHAWDIRLISAEALIKLVAVKENTDAPETGLKIRSVLAPLEYTRLDRLVDVVFTTARDVETVDALPEAEELVGAEATEAIVTPKKSGWEFTDATLLQSKRNQMISAAAKSLGTPLIKKSRAQFWNSDHDKRVIFTISKRYERSGANYWYGYRPVWEEFLRGGKTSYLALGCMDLEFSFLIPFEIINNSLEYLNKTDNEQEMFWHIQLIETPIGYELIRPKAARNLPVSEYRLELN